MAAVRRHFEKSFFSNLQVKGGSKILIFCNNIAKKVLKIFQFTENEKTAR